MPKKDLWIGIAEPDPTSIVGSKGSCDSVISNNSSSLEMTDSGYDYLSVEEKECLMFLEETLHSLDTEEGSGLSTDEAEAAELSKHPRTWPTRDVPKELDHDCLGKNKTFDSKGNKSLFGSVPVVILSPGHYSHPKNINSVQASKVFVAETTGTTANDWKTLPETHSASRGPSKCDTLDIPNELPEINTQEKVSDLDSVVIPPPEPFQDKSRSHPRIGLEPILTDTRKILESGPTSDFEATRNYDIREEYEARAVQQELSLGKMEIVPENESLLKPVSPKCNKNSSEQKIASNETDHKSILGEAQLDPGFRQGPPTAPKPRKLPPNIILKTSKSNIVSPNIDPKHKIKVLLASNGGRPRAATGDFSVEKVHVLQKEQGRARREALEKLGLPLDNEKNSDEQVIKTSTYLKSRETSRTGSREDLNVNDVPSNKQSVQQLDQTGAKHVQPIELSTPNIEQANFKSHTLERSGVGLSSGISLGSEGQNVKNNKTSFFNKMTPGFLRNNRLRPASLGMGKDFLDLKEDKLHNIELEKNYERRSYPLQPPSKFPRPPFVSVKITPKGTTEEHRREALKKLGLLKE